MADRHFMARLGRLFLLCCLAAPLAAGASPSTEAAAKAGAEVRRIVSLGSNVTETVFALGAGDEVVAVDDSSTHPPHAATLPKVGYYRSVGAEGLLSLSPTLVVASEEAGPPVVLEQLRKAGVRLVVVPATASVEGAKERIRAIAAALGRERAGEALLATLERELATHPQPAKEKTKVLFLFSPTAQVLTMAGSETAAAEIIRLAGGRLALEGFHGYKPVNAEAVIAAAPEVLLVTERTLRSLGGEEKVWQLPGVSLTPAAKARRLVVMDDLLLLGFGPRLGEAVQTLATKLGGTPTK